MRRILHLAIHDTRLFVVAKESIFFMFLMPVGFMLFFSTVLGGGSSDPSKVTVTLSVVDEDGDWLADAFITQLEGESFEVQRFTAAEAETTTFVRYVRIPSDFTANIIAGKQVKLVMTKDVDSSVQFDAAADVRLHQAQVSFLGNLVRWNPPKPAEDGTPPILSDADKGRLYSLIGESPLVSVESSFAGQGRPVPNGAGQSIPGMLAMFVVMTTLIGGAEALTREKHSGTLARLATTPFSRAEILLGKLLHLSLVGFVQALVLMAAGQLIGAVGLFGIEFSWGPNAPAIALLMVPYAVSIGCVTLFVSGLFRSTQQAESLGWLVGMVFAAVGGCWWPLEIMPQTARAVAHAVPTYWAMEGLHSLITFGRDASAIVVPSIVLMAFALLFGWLGSRTMRVV